jgi:hypothetical protein
MRQDLNFEGPVPGCSTSIRCQCLIGCLHCIVSLSSEFNRRSESRRAQEATPEAEKRHQDYFERSKSEGPHRTGYLYQENEKPRKLTELSMRNRKQALKAKACSAAAVLITSDPSDCLLDAVVSTALDSVWYSKPGTRNSRTRVRPLRNSYASLGVVIRGICPRTTHLSPSCQAECFSS